MAKFRDRSSLGRSDIAPFIPGETPRARHFRRISTALALEAEAKLAASAVEASLEVCNQGQHWLFRHALGVWEWWPSTAKLVKDKAWRRGVHCHDYTQVIAEIVKAQGRKLTA